MTDRGKRAAREREAIDRSGPPERVEHQHDAIMPEPARHSEGSTRRGSPTCSPSRSWPRSSRCRPSAQGKPSSSTRACRRSPWPPASCSSARRFSSSSRGPRSSPRCFAPRAGLPEPGGANTDAIGVPSTHEEAQERVLTECTGAWPVVARSPLVSSGADSRSDRVACSGVRRRDDPDDESCAMRVRMVTT